MAAPTLNLWTVSAAGNNAIADIGVSGGPTSAIVSGNLNFGNTLGGSWKSVCVVPGFDGNVAEQMKFWLYDPISDVDGVPNAENFFDGDGEWQFRVRISRLFIPTFSSGDIESSPWVDLPHGANPASPFDLSQALLDLNPGNDGTTGNELVVSSANASRRFTNGFLYIAVKPHSSALAGDHLNWGFRMSLVFP
jgi:hypothetical protein